MLIENARVLESRTLPDMGDKYGAGFEVELEVDVNGVTEFFSVMQFRTFTLVLDAGGCVFNDDHLCNYLILAALPALSAIREV